MTKFIKFNLYSLEVSIKLSQFMLMQRMNNTSSNSTVCEVENENLILDTVKPDSNTPHSKHQNKKCTRGVVHNYYHPLFTNSFMNLEQSAWPFIKYRNLNQHYYWGQPLFYFINRTIYTSRRFQRRNYRSFYKRLNMDIMSLRNWEKIEMPSSKPGFIFTLMSYNVLAQDLIEQHPYLYSNHIRQALSWEKRWNNILREISALQPDIICLQEVQESHIENYYSSLQSLGFTGIFKKRTGSQSDGCAIYYKVDKVKLLDHNLVEFFQPTVSVLNRDNVGIIAKFAPKLHPTREFVVATTHLLYNPRRSDVRLAQMQLLLSDIEKISYKQEQKKAYYLPIIITGDLNSPPSSDLYEYVTRGKLNYENLSPRLLETPADSQKRILVTSSLGITENSQYLEVVQKRCNEKVIINVDSKQMEQNRKSSTTIEALEDTDRPKPYLEENVGCLSHNFALKSVYNHGTPNNTEGTTFQDEWITVDYIFYSINKGRTGKEDKLKLISRLRLPTSDELENVRIPNNYLGSDHLSLTAKFKMEF